MTHICNQQSKIQDLQTNQTNIMEIMKEVKEDVKDIKKYLFEGGLEEHYAKKDSVSRLWSIVWAIIGFVFVSLGGAIVAIIKYVLSTRIG